MKAYKKSGSFIVRAADGALIPAVGGNTDYQEYLLWVADGNTPDDETAADLSPKVDQERDRRISAGVIFQGKQYQSRSTDRENISGAAQLAFMAIVGGAQPGDLMWSGTGEEFQWIASDNSRVSMDAQTVVNFGKTAAQRKQALVFAASNLKQMDPIPSDFADDKYWPE